MRLWTTAKSVASALAIAGLSALLAAQPANAAVIDFNELAHDGAGQAVYASVTSGGFNFTNSFNSPGRFLVWGATHGSNADPGGATLSHNYADSTTVMTKADGGTFSLLSIDFGDVYNGMNMLTIEIIGTRADLSTVAETVITGSLPGLETFLFENFDDLISVAWTPIAGTDNRYLQLDNIVVDHAAVSVPEPMSVALLAGGLVALAGSRRRRLI
jgi:hypothetical protein